MQKILVIIPTYNEKENIASLIDGIFTYAKEVAVLVVDDNSPDGTAKIVRELQGKYGDDTLKLIVRTQGKAGRGSACMEGFRYALANGFDAALEMDADLSHDPADIPRLIDGLKDADVVIGSKYVRGGKVIGWEWYRHCLSRGANLYARMILRIPISDYTNGFRLYGQRALALIPTLTIEGKGFTVIPQMSYQLHKAGMRFHEVPITFTNRRRGTSNMTYREISESFLAILKIRSYSLHLHATQLCKFLATGGVNMFFDLCLLAFFIEILHIPLEFAGPLVTCIVVTNVFLMNKYWTFRNTEKKHVSQGVKFLLVYAVSFILVNILTIFFAKVLGIFYILARVLSIAICALWNYTWLHLGVFGSSEK